MQKNIFLYLASFIFLLSSCVKDAPACGGNNKFVITSNSPIVAGDSLRLNVTADIEVYQYLWKGPAGFTSSALNPVIANAKTNASGVYTLIAVTKEGCMYTISSDSIIIANPVVPCNLTTNTFAVETYNTVTFTNLAEDIGDLTYTIGVSNYQSSGVTMEFPSRKSRTAAGIYKTTNRSGGDISAGQVHPELTYNGYKFNVPENADVYVEIVNGYPVASFCKLSCSTQGLDKALISSVRITAKE